uniref:UDP-glucose pyrophosphorylase 2 n=2 Tax=Homo sapiens TaxID=9606 RepID=F8WDA2_HUMAN
MLLYPAGFSFASLKSGTCACTQTGRAGEAGGLRKAGS